MGTAFIEFQGRIIDISNTFDDAHNSIELEGATYTVSGIAEMLRISRQKVYYHLQTKSPEMFKEWVLKKKGITGI